MTFSQRLCLHDLKWQNDIIIFLNENNVVFRKRHIYTSIGHSCELKYFIHPLEFKLVLRKNLFVILYLMRWHWFIGACMLSTGKQTATICIILKNVVHVFQTFCQRWDPFWGTQSTSCISASPSSSSTLWSVWWHTSQNTSSNITDSQRTKPTS